MIVEILVAGGPWWRVPSVAPFHWYGVSATVGPFHWYGQPHRRAVLLVRRLPHR